MESLIAAAIMAVVSVAGTIYTNKQNQKNFERSLTWQEEQTAQAQDYNSLPEQMVRAKQAGINPVSVAMSGSGVSSSVVGQSQSPSIPNLANPTGDFANLINAISTGDLNRQKSITEKATRNETIANMRATRDLTVAQLRNQNASTDQIQGYTKYQDKLLSLEVSKEEAEVKYKNALTKQVHEDTKKIIYEREELLPQELKNLIGEEKHLYMDINLMNQKIQESNASIQQMRAFTGLTELQADEQTVKNQYQLKLLDLAIEEQQATIDEIQSRKNLNEDEAYYAAYKNPMTFIGSFNRGISDLLHTNRPYDPKSKY